MALDPMEKEQLRKKMALKMGIFLESSDKASCVSGHYYLEPHFCELCETACANEVLVIKNRSGKILHVGTPCLREMVRFRVVDVEDLSKWFLKFKDLKAEAERRREGELAAREEERKRLEKKVIVRKRPPLKVT